MGLLLAHVPLNSPPGFTKILMAIPANASPSRPMAKMISVHPMAQRYAVIHGVRLCGLCV
jgi:hypothetical protein